MVHYDQHGIEWEETPEDSKIEISRDKNKHEIGE